MSMKNVYIPVAGSTLCQQYKWWRENDMFYYPNALASAYYLLKEPKFVENMLDFPLDKGIMMCDSGGFQAVTQQERLPPQDVMAVEEKCGNRGLILDVPPYSFGGTAMFGGSAAERFEKSVKETCENAELMLQKREKKNFELFGVIQGESEAQKRKWFEIVSKVGEFEGWALSPKPSTDLFQVASHLILAEELGLKNLHVLQIGNISGMMAIKYFASMSKGDLVTFDSSTAIRYGSHLRRMIISLFANVTLKFSDDFKGTPMCQCPVCKTLGFDIYINDPKGLRALAMHNLYEILSTSNNIDMILQNDKEEFFKIRAGKMAPVYRFLEYGLDKGLDKAADKFRDKLETSTHIHQTQRGIFSFAGETNGAQ